MHEVTVRRRFFAWHALRHYPEGAPDPHRHRWEVRATALTPELGPAGFGLDFEALYGWLAEILAGLEGRLLNELEPFARESPSAERLAEWVFGALSPRFASAPAKLVRVEVFEGPLFSAAYEEEGEGRGVSVRGEKR